MNILRQSTAVTIKIGPFLDATTGVDEETALSPGVEVSKAGGAFASKNEATTPAHDAEGWYDCNLDATDTGTLGRLVIKAQDSATHLPVWHEFEVVPANVYDSMVAGSDYLDTQTAGMDAGVVTATAVATGAIDADAIAMDAITAAKIATDAIGASELAADAVAEIADQVWDEAKSGHVGAGSFGEEVQAHALSTEISALNDPTAATIADAVWDELATGHTDAGKAGEQLWTDIDAVLVDTNALNDTKIPDTLSLANINTEVDTAIADVNLDHFIPVASTVSDVGATASDFDTALTEATNNHYNDMVILFTSGVLLGQSRRISAYNGTSKNVTVLPAFTEAPGNGDAFVIVSGVYLQVLAERLGTQAKADVNTEADTALTDYDPPTRAELTSDINSLNDPTAAAIADQVWDEAKADHVAAGSMGEEVQAHALSSEVSALNDPSAATIADAVWDELSTGHTDAGKAGQQLWTDVDAILADTNELQTDDVPGLIAALNDVSTADIDARLVAIGLDHLVSTSVAGTDIADNSIVAKLVSSSATADWDTFVNTTDSLQAIRDVEPHGTAMRGTDSAALASVATETRLAELDAANIPADVDTLLTRLSATRAGYLDNLSGGAVALASVATEARLAELDAANMPADLDSVLADTGTDGVVLAADAITSAKIAASGGNLIADHVIRRSFANAAASTDGDTKTGRSLLGAIAKLVNKVSISGSTLTITEADDTTSLYTQTISTDAAADPISGLDTV